MAFKKQQETLDLLQAKEARLAELIDESACAVQMVRNTIDNLALVNQDIETTMGEIDTYMQRLSEARTGLDTTHSKNAKIMENFAKLLCVE